MDVPALLSTRPIRAAFNLIGHGMQRTTAKEASFDMFVESVPLVTRSGCSSVSNVGVRSAGHDGALR